MDQGCIDTALLLHAHAKYLGPVLPVQEGVHAHALHRVGGGVGEVDVEFGEGPAQGLAPVRLCRALALAIRPSRLTTLLVRFVAPVTTPARVWVPLKG